MSSVVIIGDIMLDINYHGTSTRLAQEACLPVVNVDQTLTSYSLGGAANVYNNLISMVCETSIISVIGNNDNGAILLNMLEKCGNKNNIIIDSNRRTTVKNRFYVNNKLVFRYDIEDTCMINKDIELQILDAFKTHINSCEILVLSDYNKGVLTTTLTNKLIEIANENNIKVFVDPKIKDVNKYKSCFLIKPNQREGENICGHHITQQNCIESAKEICQIMNCTVCLLTLGEHGMIVYDTYMSPPELLIHTKSINVIDITGAGDVVLASFVYYYMKTYDVYKSAEFSNYCGQIKVKNLGTITITPYDILMYEKNINKVISINDIKPVVEIIKATNRTIVLTNGCFDILHVGHFNLLEKAKECGDILIVCINSDKSVKMNKGDSRPINDEQYRCKQLSMLECVDYVVVFDDKTPLDIIEKIRPDILVKGGDYNMSQILGKEYAKETRIIDYIEGFSTTSICNSVKKMIK
jgi:D-beta-D-heptose 7-phosphate kinase/D-beta-D-heptose 1-phosphate adenosyltransferase